VSDRPTCYHCGFVRPLVAIPGSQIPLCFNLYARGRGVGPPLEDIADEQRARAARRRAA
jgi:hypothetical protein